MRHRDPDAFDYGTPELDNIDDVEYGEVDLSRAIDAAAAMGAPVSSGRVVRGQRVPFVIGAGGILTRDFFPLLRAEDPRVPFWQVTLAPVYLVPQGSTFASQPAQTGNPHCEMQWGGGGVTYRTRFPYPARGASFLVSGDNVDLAVQAFDGVTVFTPATLPAVNAWCSPRGAGTVAGAGPLVLDMLNYPGLYGPAPLPGFARTMLVALDTAAATASVAWRIAGVTISSALVGAGAVHRLPIPPTATEVVVTSSAGFVAVGWELAFT